MTRDTSYRVLLGTSILENISEKAKSRLLVSMKPVQVNTGTAFIRQGDEGDCLYLIESGLCVITVNKGGDSHPVAVRGPGEMVGEMSLITGEPRNADVTAGRNVKLWRLDRSRFEEICHEYPEVASLLTEIMTRRLEDAALTAERTIGEYLITEVQGRGSTSIVYKGRRVGSPEPVAIKMLKHDQARDSDFLHAFREESRVLADLHHENIVRVYDIQYLYRTVFIIMEYLHGDSLGTRLQNAARLPWDRCRRILKDICSGLAYAHGKGLVHGDIKPGNVFLLDDDCAKIIDFGLACRVGTTCLGFFGTPTYAAPEQISGDAVTESSDVYSLGLLVYRMATGKDAFPDRDASVVLMRQLYEKIPDPRLAEPDLPDDLRNFILRATRKDPAHRYPSILQGIKELA
ncbi:MAG: protein kinase [Desulfomonilaceae bacterium]|nr:protein kinase [Desulfomonilaceae bacterium]